MEGSAEMTRRPLPPATPPPPKWVTCATCRHFHRDTSGASRNIYTRQYFMGESDIGCNPDKTYNPKTGTAKIFADKPRICPNHQLN